MLFKNARASMPNGGEISGSGKIEFPGFVEQKAAFEMALKGKEVALVDALSSLGIESKDMHGKVSGFVEFGGPLSTSLVSRINGRASLSIDDGHLARVNIFAGLTDYLAKNVPGVSSLVDQSDAEIECTISNGVINATSIKISGDIFSIAGKGTYSIPEDKINIRAQVHIFKNNSIIGKLTSPLTWTFSKLLMEFKVYGSVKDPKWEYISVFERLL